MAKAFFMTVFFVGGILCSNQDPSVQTLIEHFEILKNECDKKNQAKIDSLRWYQNACNQALTQKILEIVLYRVMAARVIYSVGFDVFEKNINPYLDNLKFLKTIEEVNPCKKPHSDTLAKALQEWSFVNWHYSMGAILNMGTPSQKREISELLEYFDLNEVEKTFEKVPSCNSQMFYCSEKIQNNFKLLFKSDDGSQIHILLDSPERGVVFAGGPYYGILDYTKQCALLCNIIGFLKTSYVDFSKLIPWNQIRVYGDSISVCIKGMYLVLMLNIFATPKKKYLYFKMSFDSIKS